LIPRKLRRGFEYTVTKVEQTGNASAITLHPVGRHMGHRSGQFAFFTFQEAGMGETHPFTISCAPREDGSIRISVAALGDYTKQLSKKIEVGMTLCAQGPYGRFTLPRGSKRHVWIAGGIGITPFLSWLENMDKEGPKIDLIYTFRGEQGAPHLYEIKKLTEMSRRVSLHLFDTTAGPRLTPSAVSKIVDGQKVRYAFCGPALLLDALISSIGRRRFHYEAFEIRTGLPIPKKITHWLSKQWKIRKPSWIKLA
jgi:predicted ferric reductase